MYPILTVLHVGSISPPIPSFGVMLGLAILVGSALSVRAASRAGLDVGATLAAIGFVAGGAFAGAWTLFIVVEFVRGVSLTDAVHQGGLVLYGAHIGGLTALWAIRKPLELPILKLLDLSVPAIATAQALGRIGCFLAGCCFGIEWHGPWAVHYDDPLAPAAIDSLSRHPVPLYESLALLIAAILFSLRSPARIGRGTRFLTYAGLYAAWRFAIEFARGDTVRGTFLQNRISTSQVLSLVVFFAILGVIAIRFIRTEKTA